MGTHLGLEIIHFQEFRNVGLGKHILSLLKE